MARWKLQAVEPDSCDGAAQGRGCRYIELWDAEADPIVITVAGADRLCAAHADPNVPLGKIRWADGNWKDKDAYIAYQRAWFKNINHVEWLARGLSVKDMPDAIRPYSAEPPTTGSIVAPAPTEVAALDALHALNLLHNRRQGRVLGLAEAEGINVKLDVTWNWIGTADARVLHIQLPRANAAIKTRVRNAVNTEFGAGKVIVD